MGSVIESVSEVQHAVFCFVSPVASLISAVLTVCHFIVAPDAEAVNPCKSSEGQVVKCWCIFVGLRLSVTRSINSLLKSVCLIKWLQELLFTANGFVVCFTDDHNHVCFLHNCPHLSRCVGTVEKMTGYHSSSVL